VTTPTAIPRTIPPVEKSVLVSEPIEEAFRRFTAGIGTWWPLHTHSVGEKETEAVVFEEREGGRVYERLRDGHSTVWGTVLAWEPPRRFVMTWHPGREADGAQQLEVKFTALEDNTRVDLVHRGWELLGEKAEETRAQYDKGWDSVIDYFAK
jgi:uncharacterized protein YndB with AHSA1/START domain